MTEADHGRFATLRAIAAIAMIQLVVTEDDRGRPVYYCHKLAPSNHFANLDDVSQWLEKVTGKKVEA